MKILAWIVGVPVGLFILMLIIGALSGPPSEKSNARAAISTCWSEQQRKSATPGEQRFIAGACEQMERDFEVKYRAKP